MRLHGKSAVAVVALVAGGMLAVVAPASATIAASLSPTTQYRAYGATATWSAGWSGGSPYNTTFTYGDGTSTIINNTSTTSHSYNDNFYPCIASTFYQQLKVSNASGSATQNASTHITSGGAC